MVKGDRAALLKAWKSRDTPSPSPKELRTKRPRPRRRRFAGMMAKARAAAVQKAIKTKKLRATSDRQYVLAVVKKAGMLLQYAHVSIRANEECAIAAVENDVDAFQYCENPSDKVKELHATLKQRKEQREKQRQEREAMAAGPSFENPDPEDGFDPYYGF